MEENLNMMETMENEYVEDYGFTPTIEETEVKEESKKRDLVGVAIGAGLTVASIVVYKKVVKPGLRKLRNKLDDILAEDEEIVEVEAEESDNVIDLEAEKSDK